MAHVSPHHFAFVCSRRRNRSGAELRAHPWRVWRCIDGWRKSCWRDPHRLHRHLRPRAVARLCGSQSPGDSASGHLLRCSLPCLCGQPPRVDDMGHEVNSRSLFASIRAERRNGGVPFLLDISIEAPPGITILFGSSGAGKSTLLDCIAGLVRPDAGRISIDEEVLFDSAMRIDVAPPKRRIAYVFQSLALFPHLTVEQNIEYGMGNMPEQAQRTRVEE